MASSIVAVCLLLALGLVLSAWCQTPAPPPPPTPLIMLGTGLFTGKIIGLVQPTPNDVYDLQVLVEHVYYDPDPAAHLAAGQTLNTTMINDLPHGVAPRPALELGQEGLWVFTSRGRGLSLTPDGDLFLAPSRRGLDPHYTQNLALAAAVAKVGQAPPGARYPLLLADGSSAEFRVAHWAISRLEFVNSPAVFQGLQERLERGSLSLGGQLGADQVLNFNDWQGWRASPQRKALFRRWASGPLDAEASDFVLGSLYNASLGPELNLEEYSELLHTLAANPSVPADVKASVQLQIAEVPIREAARAKQGHWTGADTGLPESAPRAKAGKTPPAGVTMPRHQPYSTGNIART